MVGVSIKSHVKTDFKGLDEFIKDAIKLAGHSIEVGFDSTPHPNTDLGLADLANILENGADKVNIPPRQFMESSNDLFEQDNAKFAPITVRRILYRKANINSELLILGNKEKKLIQQVMELKVFPNPNNAASTIRIKGRDDALIESGFLKKNIKVDIVSGADKIVSEERPE